MMLPRRTTLVAVTMALLLVVGACSSAEEAPADAASSSASQADAPAENTVEVEATDVPEEPAAEPADSAPATPPAIEVGGVTFGSVEIDGVTIDYATSVPSGFEMGDEAPLLLAFPPGGQDRGLALTLIENTYSPEAQRLGWVVISPAAPEGVKYFEGTEDLLPAFLDWIETWMTPEGGAPHVAGVSNGGISSFRYAAQNPDRVHSVISFPGFPRSDDDKAALAELTSVPIRMYVGGLDTRWIPPAEETVESFTAAGGDIELTIYPDEGHVMASTRDGTVIFEQLELFRSS